MIAKLSRRAPKPVPIIWYQTPERLARIDCSGFSCVVDETTLPFVPQIVPVNLAQGEFRMMAFTAAQVAGLAVGKRYRVGVQLLNGVNEPVEAVSFILAIE